MLSFLSLGSNQGDRQANIAHACDLIEARCGRILRRSSDFFSAPWGYQSVHEYLNICLAIDTSLSPLDLLHVTQQIERELGRTVKGVYQDRPIDIDILLYEGVECSGSELTIPHPHMLERDFVLVPLREILLPSDPFLPLPL